MCHCYSHSVDGDELVAMADEDRLVETLGVDVGDVVVGVSLDELDGTLENFVADEMVLGLDVLRALVVDRILGELDAALVVLEDGERFLALVLLLGELAMRDDRDVLVAQVIADASEPDGLLGGLAGSWKVQRSLGERKAS